MFANLKKFNRFIHEDDGAVTVDYVVLSALACAVALASTDVLSGGFRAMGGAIDDELSGTPVDEQDTSLVYQTRFENGAAGWTGADVRTLDGAGNVLGPIEGTGGEIGVSREFQIDPNAESATFEFDLYAFDDFDGDSGIIFIDGVEVGRVIADNGGQATFVPGSDLDSIGVDISGLVIDEGVQLGGPSFDDSLLDSRTRISITVANPGDTVQVGVGSDATAGLENESFAIDNFTATGLADPDAG